MGPTTKIPRTMTATTATGTATVSFGCCESLGEIYLRLERFSDALTYQALPQFGIYSNVRVCADCFNNSGPGKHDPQASLDGTNNITNAISKLYIDAVNSKTAQTADSKAAVGIKECKCGMPLCICEAPPAPSSDAPPQQKITPAVALHQTASSGGY
ncbi:hypothetical protein K1719_042345 [Acacia pycnantha]|nr:hypothetical protein K1719_042345 [Acacia pycnantha]